MAARVVVVDLHSAVTVDLSKGHQTKLEPRVILIMAVCVSNTCRACSRLAKRPDLDPRGSCDVGPFFVPEKSGRLSAYLRLALPGAADVPSFDTPVTVTA